MTITGELLDRPSAVRLQPAYADPEQVLSVIRGVDPFWAIVKYAASRHIKVVPEIENKDQTYRDWILAALKAGKLT